MLINKKSKPIEDKNKIKQTESGFKKAKKNKIASPSKTKGTPQKKKAKKDENIQNNKNQFQTHQTIDCGKSKDRDGQRLSQFSKKQGYLDNKNKLLTTSPVFVDHSKSKSNSKKKSKSKSKSKINTYRSNQAEKHQKEADLIRSVQKKLFKQCKQNKDKSHSKSKDRSKSKQKDVSPLKERKSNKFNVADREIKYKTQAGQLKKSLKKKVQNRLNKEQAFLFPVQIDKIQEQSDAKIKLKKKVPQIKTQYSQRRGSYFDEQLLKKLQLNHQQGKKAQICPFMHIKSTFDDKIDPSKQDIFFKSDTKTYQQFTQPKLKQKQIEQFKKEQQFKWMMMLGQLKNLKNQDKKPERIDKLIEELTMNYISLQKKANQLSKDSKTIFRDSDSKILFKEKSQQTSKQICSIQEDGEIQQKMQIQKQNFDKVQLKLQLLTTQNIDQFFSSNQSQPSFQQKSMNDINSNYQRDISFDLLSNQIVSIHKEALIQSNKQQKQIEIIPPVNIQQGAAIDDLSISQGQQQIKEPSFKRSNNICLNQQFFNFISSKKDNDLRQQFGSLITVKNQNVHNYSIDMIKQWDSNKLSDKNLLKELNINERSFEESSIISFSRNNKEQFIDQMEKIINNQQNKSKFQNQLKMEEEMSSQSMLLGQNDQFKKKQKLVDQIQTNLIVQFSLQILRNKTILNNFLTTYSELLDNNVIDMRITSQPQPNISTSDTSNDHVLTLVRRLLNHLQINYQQFFMKQIKKAFQCKLIYILKYIRNNDEDQSQNLSFLDHTEQSEDSIIQMPLLDANKIKQFQLDVIRNEFYIPEYFSFNHSVYDLINDVFDSLRPFGSKGKVIFSLQLSHGIQSFEQAKQKIIQKVTTVINQKPYEQALQDQKYPNTQGVFQFVYFTCVDIIQQIFMQQTLLLTQFMNRR